MNVEYEEPASIAIDETRPGADTRDVVSPRLRGRHRGSIREPESAGLGDAKPVLPKKYGSKLATRPSIIAADSDGGVARSGGDDFIDLEVERLLQPDEIGILLTDQIEQHCSASSPLVLAVFGRAVADVERHHRERFACRLPRPRRRGQNGENDEEQAARAR